MFVYIHTYIKQVVQKLAELIYIYAYGAGGAATGSAAPRGQDPCGLTLAGMYPPPHMTCILLLI
jgi:hypothetical protein